MSNETIQNNWSIRQSQPSPLLTPSDLYTHLRLFPQNGAHPDDAYITALIAAATQAAEDYTQRAFMPRTVMLSRSHWADRLFLPVNPVQSVDSITYLDKDGNEQTLTDFTFVGDTVPAYIDIHKQPEVSDKGRPITITMAAGYAIHDSPPEPVPAVFEMAVKLMVGNLYENRESVTTEREAYALPQSFEYLLHPHRVLGV